jgi:two-component system alkaline phosphatase synthesis response regulator PhoP
MEESETRTILIVDDDEQIADMMEEFVRFMGNYNTVKAYSGSKALEAVQEKSPDLVLLDIMMDDMPGTEVCRTLKADEKTSHIPVVAVTVVHRFQEVRFREIMDSGVDDYVGKPFEFEDLKAAIERQLYHRQELSSSGQFV